MVRASRGLARKTFGCQDKRHGRTEQVSGLPSFMIRLWIWVVMLMRLNTGVWAAEVIIELPILGG